MGQPMDKSELLQSGSFRLGEMLYHWESNGWLDFYSVIQFLRLKSNSISILQELMELLLKLLRSGSLHWQFRQFRLLSLTIDIIWTKLESWKVWEIMD